MENKTNLYHTHWIFCICFFRMPQNGECFVWCCRNMMQFRYTLWWWWSSKPEWIKIYINKIIFRDFLLLHRHQVVYRNCLILRQDNFMLMFRLLAIGLCVCGLWEDEPNRQHTPVLRRGARAGNSLRTIMSGAACFFSAEYFGTLGRAAGNIRIRIVGEWTKRAAHSCAASWIRLGEFANIPAKPKRLSARPTRCRKNVLRDLLFLKYVI